jgi:hypothetical protein
LKIAIVDPPLFYRLLDRLDTQLVRSDPNLDIGSQRLNVSLRLM